ncbi:MAG: thiamine phosphate synthase [archaeon]
MNSVIDSKTLNIIDANIDRALEGLRFIEDVCRFALQNKELNSRLKKNRHEIIKTLKSLALNRTDLAISRAKGNDVGSNILQKEEFNKNFDELLLANFSRMQESLRVLEELSKIYSISAAKSFKSLRFYNYKIQTDFFILYKKSQRMKIFNNSKIYAVLTLKDSKKYIPLVKSLLKAGIRIIQLRAKTLSDKEILKIGKQLLLLTKKFNAILIIDDRADLAFAIGADGVHLGQDDLSVKDARAILGNEFVMGKSTHSKKQVDSALKENPDYFSVGPIFNTNTVPYKPVGPSLIKYAKTKNKPFVAIGGLNLETMHIAFKSGAKRIAVVKAVCNVPNPEKSARLILAKADKLAK